MVRSLSIATLTACNTPQCINDVLNHTGKSDQPLKNEAEVMQQGSQVAAIIANRIPVPHQAAVFSRELRHCRCFVDQVFSINTMKPKCCQILVSLSSDLSVHQQWFGISGQHCEHQGGDGGLTSQDQQGIIDIQDAKKCSQTSAILIHPLLTT